MTVGPRIVFVRFISSESPKLMPWVAHAGRVTGQFAVNPGKSLDGEGPLVWQLVSGNNRQLARGLGVHETFDDARTHASLVMAAADRLSVEVVSEAGRGVYGWFASLDGMPVMTCARWYMTDRDRRHSIELAVRSIAVATLHAGARLTDPALMAGDRAPAR